MEPLTEKYRPRSVSEFIGLDRPKKILSRLLKDPHPCSLCFIGPPGVGKTTLGMAFASGLNAGLIHVRAQRCNADSIEQVWADVQYYPPEGKTWWVVLVDEADQMSRAAQLSLLSHLDSTANLAFDFGGSTRESEPIPVIWIFTANGAGLDGTSAPAGFEARFLSRCLPVPFEAKSIRQGLPAYLQRIWRRECGETQPIEVFDRLVFRKNASVRDCLQSLELSLLTGEIGEQEQEPCDTTTVTQSAPAPVPPAPGPKWSLSMLVADPEELFKR